MKEAVEYLGTFHTQIRNYPKSNEPYKGYGVYFGTVKKIV